MSQTKNLQAALFRVAKDLFLAIWLAEWLAMFGGWGKQPCQESVL